MLARRQTLLKCALGWPSGKVPEANNKVSYIVHRSGRFGPGLDTRMLPRGRASSKTEGEVRYGAAGGVLYSCSPDKAAPKK